MQLFRGTPHRASLAQAAPSVVESRHGRTRRESQPPPRAEPDVACGVQLERRAAEFLRHHLRRRAVHFRLVRALAGPGEGARRADHLGRELRLPAASREHRGGQFHPGQEAVHPLGRPVRAAGADRHGAGDAFSAGGPAALGAGRGDFPGGRRLSSDASAGRRLAGVEHPGGHPAGLPRLAVPGDQRVHDRGDAAGGLRGRADREVRFVRPRPGAGRRRRVRGALGPGAAARADARPLGVGARHLEGRARGAPRQAVPQLPRRVLRLQHSVPAGRSPITRCSISKCSR